MATIVDVKLSMALIKDMASRGATHAEISADMLTKSRNMLGYVQAHCDHEFTPALPVNAHEGGVCKHCEINELYAAQHKRQWLALEEAGIAPWGARGSRGVELNAAKGGLKPVAKASATVNE